MTSKALIKIYNDLDIKCSFCSKVPKMSDIVKHELNCRKPKCWNNDICSGLEEDMKTYGANNCSEQCQLLDHILYINDLLRKTGGNVKRMYEILSKYAPKNELVVKQPFEPLIPGPINPIRSNSICWDQTKCGLGLAF
jgi:hypothetical protein